MNTLRISIHELTGLSIGQTKLCSEEGYAALSGLLEPVSQTRGRESGGL